MIYCVKETATGRLLEQFSSYKLAKEAADSCSVNVYIEVI